ncbi:hypothetical protein KAR48_17445 [bacterium]|nr:hypothetical protein [bacterium]
MTVAGYREFGPETKKTVLCQNRLTDLNLSNEQKNTLDSLRSAYAHGRHTLYQEQSLLRKKLTELICKEPCDTSSIKETGNKLSSVHNEIQVLTIHQLLKEKMLLNEKQKQIFAEQLFLCHNYACAKILPEKPCTTVCETQQFKQTQPHNTQQRRNNK